MKNPLPVQHIYHDLVDRLLSRLAYIRLAPKNILIVDLFCDHAKKFLAKKYPMAKIKIAGDEKSVQHFQNHFFDLIIAPFALLREEKPAQLLKTFYHVLRDKGLLLCMTLGPDTFCELRNSFATIDSHAHVYPFMDMHYLGDALKKLHLADSVVDKEEITILYDDLNLFFQDLKNLRATYHDEKKSHGLLSKNKWEKMIYAYEKQKTQDAFPITLELIYGHAWKVPLAQQYDEEKNEVTVSIERLRR